MSKYFGTDGFRGRANVSLTADHAYKIGRFLGWYYAQKKKKENKRAGIVIGKDTRLSSYMLEYSLVGGITASGCDAYLLHVTTTPSVAYVTRTEGFDCGIMISASHNPYYDNGIKLINSEGEKMGEDVTDLIEDYIDGCGCFRDGKGDLPFAADRETGRSVDFVAGRNRYVGYLISLGIHSFKGIKVGLDCANGSAWNIAKNVFEALGATVHLINASPDGLNINLDSGSTHIEHLQALVKEKGLDVGFAYDGDADRCLCTDENGNVVDGDAILYICGKYLKQTGELTNNTVVTTVMSNLGLYKAYDDLGIKYAKTAVGDRFVYEYMKENHCTLGGEQSGHIIFSKYASTGDGILTSLKIMEVMLNQKMPLSALLSGFTLYPQVLKNVKVKDKERVMTDAKILSAVEQVEKQLGNDGRVLFRKSGTEPVVRIMTEAKSAAECEKAAEKIFCAIKEQGYLTE